VELTGRITQIVRHSTVWNHHSVMLQNVAHAPFACSFHPEGLTCTSDPWALVGFVAVAGTVASVVA